MSISLVVRKKRKRESKLRNLWLRPTLSIIIIVDKVLTKIYPKVTTIFFWHLQSSSQFLTQHSWELERCTLYPVPMSGPTLVIEGIAVFICPPPGAVCGAGWNDALIKHNFDWMAFFTDAILSLSSSPVLESCSGPLSNIHSIPN